MTDKVGIFRTGADLEEAVHRLQGLLVRSRNIGLRHHADGPNPELVTAYRTQKMLKVALCIANGRAGPHREPRRALPRGLPAPRRRALAEAHARHLDGPARHAADASPTSRSTCWRWSCRPAGAATAPRTTSTTPTRRAAPRSCRQLRERLQGADRHARAGRDHALRAPAAGAVPRPQRAHRREAAMTETTPRLPPTPPRRQPARRASCASTCCATIRAIRRACRTRRCSSSRKRRA